MFYNLIKTPTVVKTGNNILKNIDDLLLESHLYFPHKTLVTQKELYDLYKNSLDICNFSNIIFVKGGSVDEASIITQNCQERNTLMFAFGGGSVLDIVKYTASKLDIPFISVPSTLSNDAVYSCVARLNSNGKKYSYGVNPPIGIIVDLEIIKKSPIKLILAGVADLVSNLSAIEDWLLAHNETGESINELAYMLAKEAVMPMFQYGKDDILTDAFLFDLTNGLVTSGLSMIISGNTRGTSGAEHLISHAIDEYFPEKSTIHGLQVGWAHMILEKKYRSNGESKINICNFYEKIGLVSLLDELIPWRSDEFDSLIPYAMKIRNRYTVFNTIVHKK